jgi:hypothetical protein
LRLLHLRAKYSCSNAEAICSTILSKAKCLTCTTKSAWERWWEGLLETTDVLCAGKR